MQHLPLSIWHHLCLCLLQLSPIVLTNTILASSASALSAKSLNSSSILQPAPKTLSVQTVKLNTKEIDSLSNQSSNIAQVPLLNLPTLPPPRNEKPPSLLPSPVPETTPLQSPAREKPQLPSPLPVTTPEDGWGSFPETIAVTKFTFVNNTAFKSEELAENIKVYPSKESPEEFQICYLSKSEKVEKSDQSDKDTCEKNHLSLQTIINELNFKNPRKTSYRFSLTQLIKIADGVAQYYANKGYKTSGAIIEVSQGNQQTAEREVKIKVIEGELKSENIKVTFPSAKQDNQEISRQRLNPNYIKSRLALAASKPLNIDKLQEALQLLQLDPLIKSVTARLSAGAAPGESILDVQVEESKSFSTALSSDNGRSPSIGSIQQRAGLREGNLLGIGDVLNLNYTNTNGSNSWDTSYTLPLNARDGKLSFTYSNSHSRVVESPFNDIDKDGNDGDIKSASRSYELTLRQPIFRSIKSSNSDASRRQSTVQEFTLGLTTSLRESQTSLLGIPFPLSTGANENGFTRVFALRFFQDWTKQNSQEVIALRSQFSFGLNALGSTINKPIPEVNEFVPDSRFFSWQGQAQWVRRLGRDKLLLLRTNAQLADRALVSSEQLSFGGLGSVRGYRQDTLQTDNGVLASAEVQLPILRVFRNKGVIQVVPFVDYGMGWNSSGKENPNPNTLASAGLGLQWRQGNDFTARLDWGIPLISVESRGKTWQENGLYFSVQWNPSF